MGTHGEKRPLAWLLEALEADGIDYMLIGMSAAVIQGVMQQTLDIDLWIDLSPRQYMRVINLAVANGATMAANTVVYLEDGTPVNFVYRVDGIGSFNDEKQHALQLLFYGKQISVLPLERIQASKSAIRRDKDLLHIKLIDEFLVCRKANDTDHT